MSTDALLLIVYVLTAIGFSFLCSVAEAVLLSITPSYVEGLKEKQPKNAARLKRLKQDNIDQSLAAILTLNTIAHTAGAIGAGAKATAVFGSAWFGVFSAVMTMAILFLSEIVPKTIGAIYWSKLVVPMMHFVQGLIVILYPIVWVSEKLTKLISHGKTLHHFSRDEFIAMAELGKEGGQIHDSESRIIGNLFRYGSVKAMDVMTPRTVAFALSENKTVSEVFELIKNKPFSRLPVYKSDFDDITGFVLRDDILLSKAADQHDETLKSLKRDITVVPEGVSLPMLLDSFLNERQHIALVVDEYGRTKGIVTLEDLVETLLGVEIMDEMDSVENMRALARKMWMTRAKALGIEVERLE
ncbi:hemolysin family protein [Marinomonas shanghaiensis]|uniref:hemolysin family protein n=1 Tax=Marinomonas shanghaiensis TaxID=2202418 RepID=UPI0018E4E3F6|nr:hemolysin family protein [Marinomonas shanghaiensis]